MVTIPTTDRKYYDTTRKVNAMAEYAGALLPAAKQYQQVVYEAEKSRLVTEESSAKLEMNELTTNWRLQNSYNPFNEESLQQLQVEYDEVLLRHRENIDPVLRDKWDMVGNKLKSDFQMSNQNWGFEQSVKNERADFNTFAENTVKNVSYDNNLTPAESAQIARTTVAERAANTPSITNEEAAKKTIEVGKNAFIENIKGLIANENLTFAKQVLEDEMKLEPKDRNISNEDVVKLLKEIDRIENAKFKQVKDGVINGSISKEKLESYIEAHPEKGKLLLSNEKTSKNSKKILGIKNSEKIKSDFEDEIKKEFEANDDAYGFNLGIVRRVFNVVGEFFSGNEKQTNREEYEDVNFVTALTLCDRIEQSDLSDDKKKNYRAIISQALLDRNFVDDIETAYAEYKILLNKYGTIDMFNQDLGENAKGTHLAQKHSVMKQIASDYMDGIVSIMSNISPREKEISFKPVKNNQDKMELAEFKKSRVEEVHQLQKEFLMQLVSRTYGVPLSELEGLKKGDYFSLPSLGGATVQFIAWTPTDMIVETANGVKK